MVKSLIGLVFSLFISSVSNAGELKILDSNGLIRAFKDIANGSGCVVVEVSEDMDLKISHELGFLKEIQGRRVSNQVLQFSGVTAGVWKIVKNKEQGLITRVEIANTDCDSLLK